MNLAFYEAVAPSFSKTREHPWSGWDQVMRCAARSLTEDPTLFDAGCGNLRFEDFVAKELRTTAKAPLRAFAIDGAPSLLPDHREDAFELEFIQTDICSGLEAETLGAELAAVPQCSLSVSFGLMHHIPLPSLRMKLLELLMAKTRPGGIVAVTFWQFAHDERLRSKALRITEDAEASLGIQLDTAKGDYLLGWQGSTEALRYCHSFSDEEIDQMVALAKQQGGHLRDRFSADGKSGDLNRYLVFEVR